MKNTYADFLMMMDERTMDSRITDFSNEELRTLGIQNDNTYRIWDESTEDYLERIYS
jgi:hypothetical protein